MRRLFQARGDENLPTPRRQFAERLQQATDLGVTADDALRVEAFVGHLQQLRHLLPGEQAGVALAAVGGNVQGNTEQVGLGLLDLRASSSRSTLR